MSLRLDYLETADGAIFLTTNFHPLGLTLEQTWADTRKHDKYHKIREVWQAQKSQPPVVAGAG